MTKFADLLRDLRREAGLSQEMLAERAGISLDAIGAIERGLRSSPHRGTIAALANALQLSGDARTAFEDIARRKPSSASLACKPDHNLPWQPTRFIGRQREIDEISALLGPRRLVTVTGAGGIGKTRTSLEVASRLAQPPRDGVWLVDLTPIGDGAFVASKIGSVLNLELTERDDPIGALVLALKTRAMLVILDNCEHVIAAVRELTAALLKACPEIVLLATSRERLAIAGEHTYRLPPMSVPSKAETAAVSRAFDAIQLFADRATVSNYAFRLPDEHVELVADICRRLDGVPLAIELAAARAPIFGLLELRAKLSKHFRLIAGGNSELPARQRALHATISWSHNLLDEPERVLFRRLAVFAHGWTLEAAEVVCADGILESTLHDALISLVNKSLVNVDLDAAMARYSFLASTRAYASEQLENSGEVAEISRAHAQWISTFAERYRFTPRRKWEMEVAPEFDNVLAALDWALGPADEAVLAGQIAGDLRGFWLTSGLAMYGRRYLQTIIERVDANEHPAIVARLLFAQFQFLDFVTRVDAMKRAVLLLEPLGDRRMLANCFMNLAFALTQTGEYSQAEEASEKASVLIHQEGRQQTSMHASLLTNRAHLLLRQSRVAEARSALAESLAIAGAIEDEWCIAAIGSRLAELEFAAGSAERALALGKDALADARRLGMFGNEVHLLCNLACFNVVLGNVDAAETNAREAIDLARSTSDACLHEALQHLAAVATLRGEPRRAARLIGYLSARRDCSGHRLNPHIDQKGYDVLMTSLRKQLAAEEISALAVQGAQLSEEAAVATALTPAPPGSLQAAQASFA